MGIERAVRLVAGFMVLLGAGLTYFVSPWWILFTVFIGVNLVQSSLTKWCLMAIILRSIGLGTKEEDSCAVRCART
jgi:hypothetical protein